MRRLARPPGLPLGLAQPQPQQPPYSQKQQRRHVADRKRLSNHPRGTPIWAERGASAKKFPTFELPDVVLDLDAEGSPHVRPYVAKKDGPLQESAWGYDPFIEKLQRKGRSMLHYMKKDLNRLNSVTQAPFSGLVLSDVDIMAVSLMAQPTKLERDSEPTAKSWRASALQLDLDRNGIPRIIGKDANKAIPFMLHRKELALAALKDPSKRSSQGDSDEQEVNKSIAMCQNIAQLKRLYSRLDRPESGVEFSPTSIDHVHVRLLEFLRSGAERSTSADILRFVNNLTINRLSANKELDRSMTLFGLQLASDFGLLPCVLQYLQICLFSGFISSRAEGVTLTRSLTASALLAALQRGEGTTRGVRQQIFTLMTGRGSDGLAPMPSLFGLVAEDHEERPEIFELSVRLLGELGALRLLVHHWRQRTKQTRATRQLMENEQQQGQARHEADDVFVQAFLRCTQILGGVKADEIRVDLTKVTGDVEEDAGLDLQNINAMDAIHASRGSEIPKPSSTSLERSCSVDDIKDAFNKPDIRTSMGHLKDLIDKSTEQA